MPEEESIQELPGSVETESGGGNSIVSSWMPVLAILILTPVITFAMAEFILIPRMQKALGAGSDSGGSAHQSAKAGEHAEDGEAVKTYKFDNIVANLSGSLKSRYVKVSFSMEGVHPNFKEVIVSNEPKLIDATLGILSALTLVDLEEPGIKNILRSDLLNVFEIALNERVIEQLYFSEFVVQ